MDSCFLTGGSSQVGSWLAPQLVDRGWDVNLISRGRRTQLDYGARAHWRTFDLSDRESSLPTVNARVLFHAQTHRPHEPDPQISQLCTPKLNTVAPWGEGEPRAVALVNHAAGFAKRATELPAIFVAILSPGEKAKLKASAQTI